MTNNSLVRNQMPTVKNSFFIFEVDNLSNFLFAVDVFWQRYLFICG